MNWVSLVGTAHDEFGRASVSELHAVLEHIRPAVIFLEMHVADLRDHFETCTRYNLESKAVRRYRQSHKVELVPVDIPTPDVRFFEDTYNLRKSVWEVSPEYRGLKKCLEDYVSEYGLAYLNSEHHSKTCSDMDNEMLGTVSKMNDARLTAIFELWNRTNELREQEWMKGISKYCRENSFDKGVFLVGAAHRQAIIGRSIGQTADDSTRIQWDFSGWLEQMIQESARSGT